MWTARAGSIKVWEANFLTIQKVAPFWEIKSPLQAPIFFNLGCITGFYRSRPSVQEFPLPLVIIKDWYRAKHLVVQLLASALESPSFLCQSINFLSVSFILDRKLEKSYHAPCYGGKMRAQQPFELLIVDRNLFSKVHDYLCIDYRYQMDMLSLDQLVMTLYYT
jgi:hypothetical protein